MNSGRRNLKQVASAQDFTLKQCQSIAQIVSLRGSNQTETIKDAKGDNSSALFKLKKKRSNRSCNLLIMDSFWSLLGRNRSRSRSRRRRTRRRSRGRDMSEIPEDLVVEILIRLPANYLARAKCVSKQWSSLISSRYFCTRRKQQQQRRLYMCLVDKAWQRVLLSMSLTSPDSTRLVVDQDLSIPGMGGLFLNGLHGLMCFKDGKTACVFNPGTGQRLTLPKIKPDIIAEGGQWRHHTRYYIGHDPVSDNHKVFCTIVISSDYLVSIKSEHWVFVLKAGGSWRKVVPHESYHPHVPVPFSLGRSISGSVVHYMAWHNMYTCAVVSFDVRSEEFTTILVPQEVRSHVSMPGLEMKADLIEYGGKIAVFEHTYLRNRGAAELWVLEDAEKQEWSNTSLVLQPCQRHLVSDIELLVKGTTQDGKVILAPLEMHSRFYILCYDLQSNDLRKVEIKGVPHPWFDKECTYFDLRLIDESERVIYLET